MEKSSNGAGRWIIKVARPYAVLNTETYPIDGQVTGGSVYSGKITPPGRGSLISCNC